MQTLAILLLTIGALGVTIAVIGKLFMGWPAAGKAAGLGLGIVIIGAIFWAAAPATPTSDQAAPDTTTKAPGVRPPELYRPRPNPSLPPPPAPRPPPPPATR